MSNVFLWSKHYMKQKTIQQFKLGSGYVSQNGHHQVNQPTIERNVKKYKRNFSSLNLNKGRYGRRVGVRTP